MVAPRRAVKGRANVPRDKRVGRGMGKAEAGAETRARLIEVARGLFGELGYAATSTERILEGAEVTRGALYHHFGDKADLMRAVCEEVYAEVTRLIGERAAAAGDPWRALVAGCDAFLDAVSDPALVRILFLDGPAVVGHDEWDAIERAHGLRSLIEGIEQAMSYGALARRPVEPLAVLLNGALNEAVYWAARQEDRARAIATARSSFRHILNALHQPGGARAR